MVKDSIAKPKHNVLKPICEFVIVLITALIICLIFSTIIVFIYVDGSSMEPTIHNKDVLLVNKLSYKFNSAKSGDIIIFPYKGLQQKTYIKRVVAVPGDKIDFVDNKIYINDECLEEKYIYEDMEQMGDIQFPVVIPENYYFVMGDNRNHSADSRYSDVGMIYGPDIIGKVQFRFWSFKSIGDFL